MKLWIALCLALCAEAETNADLKEQVRKTEIAFAKTMAERDAAAFTKFLSKEVVFMSGGKSLRGPQQVSDA
jgi:ketosteroid isomerase-like protein